MSCQHDTAPSSVACGGAGGGAVYCGGMCQLSYSVERAYESLVFAYALDGEAVENDADDLQG